MITHSQIIVSNAGGVRKNSSAGEWPVSYHGTKRDNTNGIADQGYLLSKGRRHLFGRGIYSTPSIEVAAAPLYAVPFHHNNKEYKLVFQNRVSTTGLKVIDRSSTGAGEYWLQPNQELIRPYGLCIKEV